MRLRCGGRLVLSDVGMSRAYDGSFPFGVRDASRAAAQLEKACAFSPRSDEPVSADRGGAVGLVPGGGDNVGSSCYRECMHPATVWIEDAFHRLFTAK